MNRIVIVIILVALLDKNAGFQANQGKKYFCPGRSDSHFSVCIEVTAFEVALEKQADASKREKKNMSENVKHCD